MPPTLVRRHRPTSPRVQIPPVSWSALGLTLAAALLLAFYVLVSGAVQTSQDRAAALRLAGQRSFACRAAPAVSRDLCMLTAAVPAQFDIQAGSHRLVPTGLQARAD